MELNKWNAEDFLIEKGLYEKGYGLNGGIKTGIQLIKLLEEYHQSKLKLLSKWDVGQQIEQLVCGCNNPYPKHLPAKGLTKCMNCRKEY